MFKFMLKLETLHYKGNNSRKYNWIVSKVYVYYLPITFNIVSHNYYIRRKMRYICIYLPTFTLEKKYHPEPSYQIWVIYMYIIMWFKCGTEINRLSVHFSTIADNNPNYSKLLQNSFSWNFSWTKFKPIPIDSKKIEESKNNSVLY